MKKILLLILLLTIIVGCDIATETIRPGAFGNSQQDIDLLTKIQDEYGIDFRAYNDNPTFVVALMSDNIIEYIPQTNVDQYSADANALDFWFVYDDFKDGDEIIVKWYYKTTNEVIAELPVQATGDFGRGTSKLLMPDGGWPKGDYGVTIYTYHEGEDINMGYDVSFRIGDNPIYTTLPFDTELVSVNNKQWFWGDVLISDEETRVPLIITGQSEFNSDIISQAWIDTMVEYRNLFLTEEIYIDTWYGATPYKSLKFSRDQFNLYKWGLIEQNEFMETVEIIDHPTPELILE